MAVRVSVPTTVHDTYLASYPLTYVFALPAASSALTGQWRANATDPWTDLTEPTGRVDGQTIARFDYPNNRAYLSVPFTAASDDLHLRVVDSVGTDVGGYRGITRYYDNRTCGVVCTYDDWTSLYHASFVAAAQAHREYGLWFSPGINAGGKNGDAPLDAAKWTDMQTAIDAGWLEPINHGLTHKNTADYVAGDAESEIGQGAQTILDNITMPPQSRRGATQKVQGWIRPFGSTSAEARTTLAAHDYLCDRTTNQVTETDYYAWATDGLYSASDVTVKVLLSDADTNEAGAVTSIKAAFDTAYARRALCIVYSYPHWWDSGWGAGTPARDWLAYLGANTDIWAVGWGHLYQYRHLARTVTVENQPDLRSAASVVGTQTCPLPAGAQPDDLLVAFHSYSGGGSAAPTGWTEVEDSRDVTGGSWNQSALYTARLSELVAGDQVFTGSTSGAQYAAVAIAAYTDVDSVATWQHQFDTPSGATFTAPAAAAPTGGRVVRIWHAPSGGRIPPHGAAVDRAWAANTLSSRAAYALSDHTLEAGGTADAQSITLTTNETDRHGWTLVLAPTVAAAPSGDGQPLDLTLAYGVGVGAPVVEGSGNGAPLALTLAYGTGAGAKATTGTGQPLTLALTYGTGQGTATGPQTPIQATDWTVRTLL